MGNWILFKSIKDKANSKKCYKIINFMTQDRPYSITADVGFPHFLMSQIRAIFDWFTDFFYDTMLS